MLAGCGTSTESADSSVDEIPSGFLCPDGTAVGSEYLVGAGMYDVTGPAADLGLMGYAKPDQIAKGIHLRLWARAFVVTSVCDDESVALVTADLQSVSIAVREAVLERLAAELGDRFDRSNVMLAATHTHSGPGGYAKHVLYDISVGGFNQQNFDAIVDGLTRSILRAHDDRRPATLRLSSGSLPDTTINRSAAAYAANPPEERATYDSDVDDRLVLMRFDATDGEPLGVMTWFSVHPTSMSNANHLVSGDNKGLAAHLFERAMWSTGDSPRAAGSFVAAFANGTPGDVSPLLQHDPTTGEPTIARTEDFADSWRLGQAQYDKARALFEEGPFTTLTGGLAAAHAYVRMDDRQLASGETTCAAAIGLSMLAGAEDGPGVGSEGQTCASAGSQLIPYSCSACQAEKPIVAGIHVGQTLTGPWTPPVLPLQLIRLGSHYIAAAPFELTTMAGRRIRDALGQELAVDGEAVIPTSPANGYSGYCATREEYSQQHYEGASTHFGPHQLEASIDVFVALGRATQGEPHGLLEAAPIFEANPLIETNVNHQFDGKPIQVNDFGEVVNGWQPKASYQAGDTVSVHFWGAHLARDLRREGESFVAIERQNEEGGWEILFQDWDWETRLGWVRDRCFTGGGLCTKIVVDWLVTDATPPGRYRIVHRGAWKSAWDGSLTPYSGVSNELVVR
jgi:neutral ceramidase